MGFVDWLTAAPATPAAAPVTVTPAIAAIATAELTRRNVPSVRFMRDYINSRNVHVCQIARVTMEQHILASCPLYIARIGQSGAGRPRGGGDSQAGAGGAGGIRPGNAGCPG